MLKPTVSVIMPVYNDAEYLWEAIESVKKQTYTDWEIIIVDDGSDKKTTIDVIKNIHDEKIKIIRTKNNGPSAARNTGIKEAHGKYILPLDADDLIDATYVEKAVDIMENDGDIGIVYCKAELFGKRTGIWELPEYNIGSMLIGNMIFVTSLFKKSDWECVGGFDENLKHGIEDYEFWLSLLELNVKVYKIPEVLFHYRIKEKSRNIDFSKKEEQIISTHRYIVKKHLKLYQENIEDMVVEGKKKELEINSKIEKIKERIPFYKFISKNKAIKSIIKKIFYVK